MITRIINDYIYLGVRVIQRWKRVVVDVRFELVEGSEKKLID